jgi:UDP-N-acetylglucosamine 1-carboxyvinyltransferase
MPDRIETGTYAMAVAMAGGDVLLERDAATISGGARRVRRPAPRSSRPIGHPRRRNGNGISPVDIDTDPFPASRPTCRRSSWR